MERLHAPPSIATRPQVVMISKKPHSERYGFFTIAEEQKKVPPAEGPSISRRRLSIEVPTTTQ